VAPAEDAPVTEPSEIPDSATLLALAEQVKATLPPVRPSSMFVEALKHELTDISPALVEVPPQRWPSWIVGAATVGSVLSLYGLLYLLRGSQHPWKKAA